MAVKTKKKHRKNLWKYKKKPSLVTQTFFLNYIKQKNISYIFKDKFKYYFQENQEFKLIKSNKSINVLYIQHKVYEYENYKNASSH